MADLAVRILIIGAGLINFAPVIGLLSRGQIVRMYQTPIEGVDLAILMRHRAALFGVVGGFMLFAAFQESLHFAGILMGLAAMFSYIALAVLSGGYNTALRTIIWIDVLGVCLLVSASILKLM